MPDLNSETSAPEVWCATNEPPLFKCGSVTLISSPVQYWPWVHGVHTHRKAFYLVFFINKSYTDDWRKLLVRWTLSLRKVVQSSALYCATRLLIGENYWYAGLSVRREN